VRRSATLGVLAMTAAAWLIAVPGSAAADPPVLRTYEGTTSAGDAIQIFATARRGVARFQSVGLEGTATCEDGSTVAFAHGFDLGTPGIPIVEGALDLENVGFADAFFLAGTLGTRMGSGTLTHLFAALDAAEEPQVCTTGEITWSVARVFGIGDEAAGPILTVETAGVVETAALPGATAPAPGTSTPLAVERLRSYEGRTSARFPMFAVTSRRDGGIVLHELGVGWELACEDGSSVALGLFIFFAGEPLDPGRIDYDVTAPEIAFHVNGVLGPHAGEGTTTGILPALTPDLGAQGCRSGDLTWTMWRTDAGARRG
jgi:hypothetical protein